MRIWLATVGEPLPVDAGRQRLLRTGQFAQWLAAHGHEIQGVALQSYLFFGSASGLQQKVKQLLSQRSDCRFLVFDFRLVTGLELRG